MTSTSPALTNYPIGERRNLASQASAVVGNFRRNAFQSNPAGLAAGLVEKDTL